jgi:fluoride exporter
VSFSSHHHPSTLGAVALGGAVGALLRWVLEVLLPTGGLPWATLLTNVVGCAAFAALVAVERTRPVPLWVRPGVGTGLLGGFTTFSVYAVQVAVLGTTALPLALAYLLATPVLCILVAVGVGEAVQRWAGRGR